jgi:hypothetical protein
VKKTFFTPFRRMSAPAFGSAAIGFSSAFFVFGFVSAPLPARVVVLFVMAST